LPTIGKQRNKNLLRIQQKIIFPRDVPPKTKKNELQGHLALAVQIHRQDGLFEKGASSRQDTIWCLPTVGKRSHGASRQSEGLQRLPTVGKSARLTICNKLKSSQRKSSNIPRASDMPTIGKTRIEGSAWMQRVTMDDHRHRG
jgi:hypothetical protein